MKKLLVAFLLTNSILFAFTDEERRFWERVNPEQLKKWEKVRSQMGSSANEDQTSKQKEDNENEIVGYTQNNIPITKADMKWRVTMNSLSASNSKEWGKVVTMPDNCKSGLDNKLYDIMAVSTNILNQHPKDWLNGKYLEFVNSKCSLVGTYTLRDTTKEDFNKLVYQSHIELPKEQKDVLSLMCKALEEKYTQIQTLKIDTAKKLSEQKELNLTDKELQTLNDELKELQTTIDELQKSIGSLEKELEINAINNKKHEDKIKELENKKETFKVWIKLNEMIGSSSGDKFAKFAQGITLDQLIYLANKHLQILSPRYELQRSSDSSKLLEIEIIDGFQGDVVRPVSTLSGGENFIVSLSLALGLSALASQKISIDSLFLDEGFGTLDSDSLELALNALNQLQSSGKMVGVISHVEALKERIPLQIRVMPKGDGTSELNLN